MLFLKLILLVTAISFISYFLTTTIVDIAEMSTLNPVEGKRFAQKGHRVMNFIEKTEKPVIAAINGFALGGGCELAMACDFRIASAKAVFGQPEAGLGITPGFGGTQRLSKIVGPGNAAMLILTAQNIKADEALRMGLVQKVVEPEELLPTVETLAKKIASNAPVAVMACKTLINKGMNPVWYSFLYNIFYIGGEGVLTLIVLALPPVKNTIYRLKAEHFA